MVIDKIFPNPTVKQVAFEIRFPTLFYIENKIGDLQLRIMEQFPTSSLLFRRQLLFVDKGPEAKLEEVLSKFDEEGGRKIWQFKSDKDYELNLASNSLAIISRYHKTYNLDGADKFRDAIKYALTNFFDVMSIPIVNRIGLRYIDECPLPSKDNETFMSYYNSVFPIHRFNIADADEIFFRTVVKRGNFHLIYMETLKKVKDEFKLVLDFDGFAMNVKSDEYLNVTDELHSIVSEEYERTIKEPVYEYMGRGGVGSEQ